MLHTTFAALVANFGRSALAGTRDGLERTIEDMIWRHPDGRLPTERSFAAELGASRHAVRKALEQLEVQGKIWRHVGRGTFAGSRPALDPGDLPGVIAQSSPREIVAVRMMIEPEMAASAAIHAASGQVAAIEDAFRRCAAARNIDSYETCDEAFHRAIAAATGNMLLRALFEAVNKARKEIVWGTLRKSLLRPERRERFTSEHARIVEAVQARDAQSAWQAMREHIGTLVEVYSAVETVRAGGRGPALL